MSDISLCFFFFLPNSSISPCLHHSTCCRLRKLQRGYCSWPTPTWALWWLRWTSCTAGYGRLSLPLTLSLPLSLRPAVQWSDVSDSVCWRRITGSNLRGHCCRGTTMRRGKRSDRGKIGKKFKTQTSSLTLGGGNKNTAQTQSNLRCHV